MVTMVCTGAFSEKSPKPLSKGDVIRLLKGNVSPKRVADLARERRIDFDVTLEVEKQLREAGRRFALGSASRSRTKGCGASHRAGPGACHLPRL